MTKRALPSDLADITEDRRIDAEDVVTLRRTVFRDGIVSDEEAEIIFAVDQAVDVRSAAWRDLFVEALTDYIVHQQMPSGYVDDAKAEWLIAQIDRDGRVQTDTEFELLVNVLEKAVSSPAGLSAYALEQVKHAVLQCEGPAACGHIVPGRISGADVALIRRILYAFGGDGAIAVTQPEVEVLFDLNDKTVEVENDPAWSDLFVKAVANFLMAVSGYKVPTRAEALCRDAWLDSRDGVSGFMSKMLAGGLRGVWSAYLGQDALSPMAEHNARRAREIGLAEKVTDEEAHWLADRIGRDGRLHENETALIHFLRDEAPDLPPVLQTIVDAA